MRSQRMWPIARWHSWTRWVSVEGTQMGWSTAAFSLPPFSFVRPIDQAPALRAAFTPSSTFGELPLVEMAMTASPFRQ